MLILGHWFESSRSLKKAENGGSAPPVCTMFRHATVFLIFKDKTIQPARLSFQAKVQYRKHEPVHYKNRGRRFIAYRQKFRS